MSMSLWSNLHFVSVFFFVVVYRKATRFDGDALLPQTRESSVPYCFGCPANYTIEYDHCKSHANFVNTSILSDAAANVPACAHNGTNNDPNCIDEVSNLRRSRVFLTRGECRTYTGNAVLNSVDVYKQLGASQLMYFDQCNPDGSHKPNDTTKMCLEHVFGSSTAAQSAKLENNFLFPQVRVSRSFFKFSFSLIKAGESWLKMVVVADCCCAMPFICRLRL